MKEGETYDRVHTLNQPKGVLVVAISRGEDGKVYAEVGKTVGPHHHEGVLFTDVPAALAYASAELGAPGADRVVVHFEDDSLWRPAWGDWTNS